MSNLVFGGGGETEAHEISNSLVLNDYDVAYLDRTFGSGDTKTWTYSIWIKRSILAKNSIILTAGNALSAYSYIRFNTVDQCKYNNNDSIDDVTTNSKHRDPAYWANVVVIHDSTETTEADRIKIYIDGVRQDLYGNNFPLLDGASQTNSNIQHAIGKKLFSAGMEYGGYIAEVIFLDGVAAPVTSFGEVHPLNASVWRPKNPAGLDFSGTNSFHLDFKDATSTTTLGYDVSGNNNHWTLYNFATSAQSIDTPTNNSCTLNPLTLVYSLSVYEGNRASFIESIDCTFTSTMLVKGGKWYFEYYVSSGTASICLGISNENMNLKTLPGINANAYIYAADGDKYHNNSWVAYGATWTTADVIGVAFDLDNGTLTFYKNNVSQGQAFSGIDTSLFWGIALGSYSSWDIYGLFNFHEDDLAYTPPSGYSPLMPKHLPEPAILDPKDYFESVIYTGNATADRVIPTNCKVDKVVIKNRDQPDEWKVVDVPRGVTKEWNWDDNNAESTDANGVTAFGASSGLTLGTGVDGYNDNNEDFAAYVWTESAIAGFDMVEYTGNGSNRTIAHGLGVVPELMIIRNLQATTFTGNLVYHKEFGATHLLMLNLSATATTDATLYNNTDPTASVFTVGTANGTNQDTKNFIAYLYASVAGFSRVFSYEGLGLSSAPFIYCGFKPAFVLIKNIDITGRNWRLFDANMRPYNARDISLAPDVTDVELSEATIAVDFVSNGFVIRGNHAEISESGRTFIGIAFAEYPFALMNNLEL